MSRGRPPLRVGERGKVSRINLGGGNWLARCRFRDLDGVVRIVERRTPAAARDQHGARAESVLLEALTERRNAGAKDVDGDTLMATLNEMYIAALRVKVKTGQRQVRTLDTYVDVSTRITKGVGALRLKEFDAQPADRFLATLAERSGPVMARQARTILNGMMAIAIRAGAITANPVRESAVIESGKGKGSTQALSAVALAKLLKDVRTSQVVLKPPKGAKKPTSRTVAQYCTDLDLADVITMFAATGLRRSELLALRWVDLDLNASTIAVSGKVVRARKVKEETGESSGGLIWVGTGKTKSSRRVISLPKFALTMLRRRAGEDHPSADGVIFPSAVGTLYDPDNMSGYWARVRDALGLEWVTSHTFRRTVATLIDEGELTARVGADHLGHKHVSTTQDIYMGRGRVHPDVARLLDEAVA